MRATILTIFFLLAGCGIGDVGSSTNNNAATVDNSTDNSQHGIASCSQGSTFVCSINGPNECSQSLQCINVNGEPVVLNGPDPINCAVEDQCPTPTPTPEPVLIP